MRPYVQFRLIVYQTSGEVEQHMCIAVFNFCAVIGCDNLMNIHKKNWRGESTVEGIARIWRSVLG